ncbi:MAG: competence protein ComEC family protein, partial [Spirochaetes bacterium]|nr:competence protein ComEC family protein [Spirochaetota bacterium]
MDYHSSDKVNTMTLQYTSVLIITLTYISGIMIQEFFSPSLLFIILVFIPSFLLILVLSKKRVLHSVFLIALITGLFNTFLIQNNYFKKDLSSFFNKSVMIRGKVASHPVRSERYSSFQLKLDTINKEKVQGTLFVFIKPKTSLMKNDQVHLSGRIDPPEGPANFGEIDYGLYYKTIQVDGSVYIKNRNEIISTVPVSEYSLTYYTSIIRKDIQKYIKKYYYPIQRSFLNALMLGARTTMPRSIKEIFIRSGTIHLLAISGLHVGMIAIIFITLFINIGFSRRVSLILTLIILILYNFIVGYKPPILRSTIMFASLLACFLFDRDRNYLNNLSLAALIILLFNPLVLQAVSFQMSFLAAAGIIIFTPILNRWIDQHIKIKLKVYHFFKTIFTASLSAQLLILPLLFYYF